MKKTSKIILGLSVAVCAVAGVAFANLTPATVKAEDLATTLSTTLLMETGARVRYSTDESVSVADYSGIRYEMLLTKTGYQAIETEATKEGATDLNKATFGMLIAPASYHHEKAKLNVEENVFGENAVYNWGVWDESTGMYVYESVPGKTQIVNVSTTIDFTSNVDLEITTRKSNGYDYYHYCGSLTKIQEKNLSREFIGVGYVYVNGEYYFAKEDDNVRSIAYVAQRAIEDTSTQEELDANARKWLQQNYVDTVASVDTEYTVEYLIPSNVSGGTYVAKTATFTGKVGQEITLTDEQLTMAGYDAPTEEITAKLYANNKTIIQANYTYNTDTKMVVALQGNDQTYVYDNSIIHYISEDYDTTNVVSGLFINTSSEEVTVSIGGGWGSAIIVDKNGRVIEGRDGVTPKLMNKSNPTRESGASLASADFAKKMTVPVGGFALVAHQPAYATGLAYGTETTDDIRAFMRTMMSHYGNCVEITLTGANQVLTEYDGANYYARPAYKNNIENFYYASEIKTKAILTDGVSVINTNGTFDKSDDTTATEVEYSIVKTIDRSTAGRQIATMSATVGGETLEIYRAVEVNAPTYSTASFTITFSDETGVVKPMGVGEAPSAQLAVNESHNDTINIFHKKVVRLYTQTGDYGFDTRTCNWNSAVIISKKDCTVVKSYNANTVYSLDSENNVISEPLSFTGDGQAKAIYDDYNSYVSKYGENYYLLILSNEGSFSAVMDTSTENSSVKIRVSLLNYASQAVGKTISISCCEL